MYLTEIHVKEKMSPAWADWFEPMQVCAGTDGDTVISGSLPDRSAVYGVLSRLSSLSLTLISVTCRPLPDGEDEAR